MKKLEKSRKDDIQALGEHANWAVNTLKYSENGKPKEHSQHLNWLANAVKKEPLKPEHKQALEHFASYYDHIPEVKGAKLQGMGLTQGIQALTQAENSGKSKAASGVVPKLGKPVIDYGNMEWRNIGIAGSEAHKKTCGHCGNTPSNNEMSHRTHERGLVLESKIDEKTNKNHLFFVNNGGYITEAKAIGNRKPSEKFHKHILDLLEHPDIKGYVGGGYLRDSNFQPEDVQDPKLKQRLKDLEQKKPGFFSPDIKELHESIQADPGLALTVTDKGKYSNYNYREELSQDLIDKHKPDSNVHLGVAQNPYIHPDTLKYVIDKNKPGSLVHLRAAQNTNITPELLKHLIDRNDLDSNVHESAARHPNITSDALKYLIDESEPDSETHRSAADNPNITPELLRYLVDKNKPGSVTHRSAANNPNITPELLEYLVYNHEPSSDTHILAVQNPNITPDALKYVIDKSEPGSYAHLYAAKHPNITPDDLRHLIDKNKPDSDTHRYATDNPSITPELLKYLVYSHEPDSAVHRLAAGHPNITPDDLRHLIDKNPLGSRAHENAAENPNITPDVLKYLIDKNPIDSNVHRSAAKNHNITPDVLRHLIDKNKPGSDTHRIAAHNPNTTPDVLKHLTDKNGPDSSVYMSVIRHPNITPELLKLLIDENKPGSDVHVHVSQNHDITPDVLKYVIDKNPPGSNNVSFWVAQNPIFPKLDDKTKENIKKDLKNKVRLGNEAAERQEKDESLDGDDELIDLAQDALEVQNIIYKNEILHQLKDPNTDVNFLKKYEFSHDGEVGEAAQEALKRKPLQKSLEKGLKGDWQKEGYKISSCPYYDEFHSTDKKKNIPIKDFKNHVGPFHVIVEAHDQNGNKVGRVETSQSGNDQGIENVEVHHDHQRKGLASAMYRHIEDNYGSIVPGDFQTSEGKAFWTQPNRPFGKSDKPEKGKPEQYQITPEYVLSKKPWIEAGNYYGKTRDYWELHHTANPKKPAGRFLVDTETDPTMSHSLVDTKHRNKGLGSAVYKILANHYGSLSSDTTKTSRSAKRVWEKIGGIPTGKTNLGRQNKQRYKITADSKELEKARGDYKNNNYSFYHLPNPKDPKKFVVYASDGGSSDAGYASFRTVNHPKHGKVLMPDDAGGRYSVYVQKEHRRQGLATGMYEHAEKVSGLKILPSEMQSEGGEQLWSPKDRTFGKALEKGLKGDWQKEGYTFREKKHHEYYMIEAYHPQHGVIGKASFKVNSNGTKLIPYHTVVQENHRRKGIASGMYKYAEKIFKTPVTNKASQQTEDAKKLWSQPNRPFGKSDDQHRKEINNKYHQMYPHAKKSFPAKVVIDHDTPHSEPNKLQKTHNSQAITGFIGDLQTAGQDKLIHSNPVTDKINHEVHETGSGITHSLTHTDSAGKRHVLAILEVYHHADESHPYVAYSQVGAKFKGKGFGKALYLQALKHHGSLRSDSHVSPLANKAWEWLGKQPNVSVTMGKPNTDESHVAVYKGLKKSEDFMSNEDMINHLLNSYSFSNSDSDIISDYLEHNGDYILKDIPINSVHRQDSYSAKDYPPSGSNGPITINKKNVIVDGNHRHAQAERDGKTHIKAWVPIVNNLNKSEDLEKGSFQRKNPINPKKDNYGMGASQISLWQHAGWKDDSGKSGIPRMEGNLRNRALHKLSGMAESRIDPKTNKRQFLLHRIMSADEAAKTIKGQTIKAPKVQKKDKKVYSPLTSWAANMDGVQAVLNDAKSKNTPPEHYSHLVSAWVDEDHIHHIPFMIGNVNKWGNWSPGSNPYRSETETILSPNHKSAVHNVQAVSEIDHNLKKSEVLEKGLKGDWQKEGYTLHVIPSMPLGTPKAKFDPKQHGFVVQAKDKDGKYAGSASIEHKGGHIIPYAIAVSETHRRKGLASGIYKHAEGLTGKKIVPEYVAEGIEPSGQSEDAKALWSQPNRLFGKTLEKGVMRTKAPYNPSPDQGISSEEFDWVVTGDSKRREDLKPHTGPIKDRALNKIMAQTQTRKNKKGEREFLMYRGMAKDEYDDHLSGKITTHTSWTPKLSSASQFTQGGENPIISAWIPESQLHHFPFMLAHDPEIRDDYRNEMEVVVKPHKTNIQSTHTLDDAYKAHQDKKLPKRSIPEIQKETKPDEWRSTVARKLRSQLNKAKAIESLEKVEFKDGTYYPEATDPLGTKHPKKPYEVHYSKQLNKKVWAHQQHIRDQNDALMGSLPSLIDNSLSISDTNKKIFKGLHNKLSKDEDRHVVTTGVSGGHTMRARHLLDAVKGRNGSSFTQLPEGFEFKIKRHSENINQPSVFHVFQFDRKGLKFMREEPINQQKEVL